MRLPQVIAVSAFALCSILGLQGAAFAVDAGTVTVAVEKSELAGVEAITLDLENTTLTSADVSLSISGQPLATAASQFGRSVRLPGTADRTVVVISGAVGESLRVIATYVDADGVVLAHAAQRVTLTAPNGPVTPTDPEPTTPASPSPTTPASPSPTTPASPSPTIPVSPSPAVPPSPSPTRPEPSGSATPTTPAIVPEAPEAPADAGEIVTLTPTPATTKPAAEAAGVVATTGGTIAWGLLGVGVVAVGVGSALVLRKKAQA